MFELRPYQREAVENTLLKWSAGIRAGLIVLPTGTGKSLVIAELCKRARAANDRVLVVTDSGELVDQNSAELAKLWPDAAFGINAAGLGRRDTKEPIIFANIASVYKDPGALGRRSTVLVDEAHMIPHKDTGMYHQLFAALRHAAPEMRIVGLTATAYRLSSGRLDEAYGDQKPLFEEIFFEKPITYFFEEGFLSPLITRPGRQELKTTGVKVRGDFVIRDLDREVNIDAITERCVAEMYSMGSDRKRWLSFGVSVSHASRIAHYVAAGGRACGVVSADEKRCGVFEIKDGLVDFSQTPRDALIEMFRAGRIPAISNYGVLTKGFNVREIDLIGLFRPTLSPGLFIQMIGRGTRTAEGKSNCLVLDFARNLERHGPIDLIDGRKKPSRGGRGREKLVKLCKSCNAYAALTATVCDACGAAFPPPAVKITAKASTAPILSGQQLTPGIAVEGVGHKQYISRKGQNEVFRIDYHLGNQTAHEYIIFNTSQARLRAQARKWWAQHAIAEQEQVPSTAAEAMQRLGLLQYPKRVDVRHLGDDPTAPLQVVRKYF